MGERNAAAYAQLREKIDASWKMNRELEFALNGLVQHVPAAPFDAYASHLVVLGNVVDHLAWAYGEVEKTQAERAALREQKDASQEARDA